jgi:hypothetical protein
LTSQGVVYQEDQVGQDVSWQVPPEKPVGHIGHKCPDHVPLDLIYRAVAFPSITGRTEMGYDRVRRIQAAMPQQSQAKSQFHVFVVAGKILVEPTGF